MSARQSLDPGFVYERDLVAAHRYAVGELTEFLTMRIAEDVGVAEAEVTLRAGDPYFDDPGEASGFELRFTPERVIADLQARLVVVARHARVRWGRALRCHCCWSDGYRGTLTYPCDTLLALAQPFADHPDFREDWLL